MYEDDCLRKREANYEPLSPLSFLKRAAKVFADQPAWMHGSNRKSYGEMLESCAATAGGLRALGVRRNTTVSVLALNTPETLELHFAVPAAGGVINTINSRLDAATVAYCIDYSESPVLIYDTEMAPTVAAALPMLKRKPVLVHIRDALGEHATAATATDNEIAFPELAARGASTPLWQTPSDEWDALALNFTSGTTGRPKGVVYSHRGAYLNALGQLMAWQVPHYARYLWTLPMFHCNGWTFTWGLASIGATSICLRRPAAREVFVAIERFDVSHLCAAPTVVNGLVNASAADRRPLRRPVHLMIAGAAPAAAVIRSAEAMGLQVLQSYGLTEVYGPAAACLPRPEWSALSAEERTAAKTRQGVEYCTTEGMTAVRGAGGDASVDPVAADGSESGEVIFRGNAVMRGYLKDPAATDKAFAGGWFRTGDIGTVSGAGGYIAITDRSKDIVITGGENVATIEVEGALFEHPAVLEAAVVAGPHEKWGETPHAFVILRAGAVATAEELRAFCRARIAHYKVPTRYTFTEALPKTSTGKIQKFKLRELARAQAAS
eukprot:c39804_g1_i1.p1 GENE.c39804_g1_i1~~c39804_g1_i1.p1  ORF type:complete len:601 (+),score=83.16 c39804_g1_i1:149-1804(+)